MAEIFYDYILDELRLKDVPSASGGFYGSFYDTTTQTISSTTSTYPITFNTTSSNNSVSIGSPTSKIVFDYAGVYSITFSVQFDNSDSQDHDATIWLRLNGSDLTDSSSVTSVPAKHGSINGKIITTINYVLTVNAGDYLETIWHADSTSIRLVTIGAGTSPTTPLSPSIIWTAVQGGIINQSNSLASLTDVSFQSLASGQIIMSDSSNIWRNYSLTSVLPPSVSALASLTDVSFVSLATGNYLKYNGVNWTNDDVFINIDGGFANSNYLITQNIDGGNA